MSDLMKDNTSFSDLISKYDRFMVPVFKIKVSGQDLVSKLSLGVDNLSIRLSNDSAASSCSFDVVNCFDITKKEFKSDILDKLKLGTAFTVELGYGSATVMVFKGYVSELTMNYSDVASLSFTGMDVKRLLMESGKQVKTYATEMTYDDVFKQVMKTYAPICPPNEIVTDAKEKVPASGLAQNQSDYKFIEKLCADIGNEFFVVGGKAYFVKLNSYKAPITKLKWGETLMSFSRRSGYVYAEVEEVGYNDGKSERINGKSQVVTKDPHKKVTSKAPVKGGQSATATTAKEAKAKAESDGDKMLKKAQSASGTCIGLPELVPGRFVEIYDIGTKVSQKYLISEVQHTVSGSGFETNFEIEGWE